jgi:hypothetical protein
MALIKNYSQFHRIEYKGITYIFDPYEFGIGSWKLLTPSGKGGKNAQKEIQIELNKIVFDKTDLPSVLERFRNSTPEERKNLRDISMTWLALRIKGIKSNREVPGSRTTKSFNVGNIYFYIYDAKLKDELPMWDRFPLTIPLKMLNDGFIGLNLHYLDVGTRAVFVNELINNFGSLSGKNLKLAVDYSKIVNETKGYESCIKRYLFSHVKSRILPLEAHELAYAVWMPVQEFKFNKTKR